MPDRWWFCLQTMCCCALVVDPFLGNGLEMAICFSGPAVGGGGEGKCVPWESPLFSGWPRMPPGRRAELRGSWCSTASSIYSLFLPSPPPPPHLPILSPCICAPSVSPSFLHTLLCSATTEQCTKSPGFGETQMSR